jgi:hypothetical protein
VRPFEGAGGGSEFCAFTTIVQTGEVPALRYLRSGRPLSIVGCATTIYARAAIERAINEIAREDSARLR